MIVMIMARGGPGVEVDMAKRAGQIKRVASQKRVQVNQFAGRVDLYFSHDFIYIYIYIYIKKTTCICHLESHATNYLM